MKAFVVVTILLLAGCTGPPAPVTEETPPPVATPTAQAAPGLVPVQESPERRWVFRPSEASHTETSVATHPHDPDIVLASWQADIDIVWAAYTDDRGATWNVSRLDDPILEGAIRALSQDAFDPVSRIGPDGTMYVLFGGQSGAVPGAALSGGITLARLDPAGWTFHHVSDEGAAFVWDAMDFSVDGNGRLHVIAQSISSRFLGYFQSDDRGATWSLLATPIPTDPAAGNPGAIPSYWPRIDAQGQRILITVKPFAYSQTHAVTSTDGGETWITFAPVRNSDIPGGQIGRPAAVGSDAFYAGFATSDGPLLQRSTDGIVWEDHLALAGTTPGPQWAVTDIDEAGRAFTLATYQTDAWSARLVDWHSGPEPTIQELDASPDTGTASGSGNEYGGISIAADGHIWLAWSRPTPEGNVAVIQVMAPPPTTDGPAQDL